MRYFGFFNWKWKIRNKETYDCIAKLIRALWKPWNQFCQTCSANQGSQRSQNFKLLVFKGILLKFGTVHFFNNRNWYHTHFWCFGSFQGTYKNFCIFSISFRSGKTWSNFELLLCFQRSTNGSSNVQNLLRALQSSLWVIHEVSGWLGGKIGAWRRQKTDWNWAKISLFLTKKIGGYEERATLLRLARAWRVPKQ